MPDEIDSDRLYQDARSTLDEIKRLQASRCARRALLRGEERQDLSPFLRELCSDLFRIPMVGAADSLNLAGAGCLLLYEVYRVRSAR